ncbi:MAG: 1-acyl-sn-glycerol-3-phosphate acyltransferase [Thermoflexales bacterium]|nr:1-acyl-sn-glycerol-3-phosphate acyltransferase [Thermoflexales bacterium]
MPAYPILWKNVFELLLAAVRLRERSFQADARAWVEALCPPLQVQGRQHIPASGPALLTVNHYSRPDFQAWWIAFAISAVVPADVHWVMTAAWTFAGQPIARPLTPLSRWLFQRIASVYHFTPMPPMPPAPSETEARAQAVRRVLDYARTTAQPLVGLSPEGQDVASGVLGWPPPGAGRFVSHLARLCHHIVPVGVYEDGDRLCLRFGAAYHLTLPPQLDAAERDRQASWVTMQAIARQLPPQLRGVFGASPAKQQINGD